MKFLIKSLASTCIVLSCLASEAFAQTSQVQLGACLTQFIKGYSGDNEWVEASSVLATCSCAVNRLASGLQAYDCPKPRIVNEEIMRKYFR